jgi:hypothetical protein
VAAGSSGIEKYLVTLHTRGLRSAQVEQIIELHAECVQQRLTVHA